MTPETSLAPTCPACRAPLEGAIGGILGGVPTGAVMESTARPFAERAAQGGIGREGPARCPACHEAVYRIGRWAYLHRGTPPVLTMAAAADRLRNHLRRLAIVRPGRIEGDCYLLPFFRMEGVTPEGDETFTLLAASIGEERLERAFLPPADLRPFEAPAEGAAGSSGEGHAALRILPPTAPQGLLHARAEASGWTVTRTLELIHYPFWLMRVEDLGRIEGAWMDGIEGKLIHHRMRLTPPMPRRLAIAALSAVPAAAACAAAIAAPDHALAVGAASWALGAPLLHAAFLRNWRG